MKPARTDPEIGFSVPNAPEMSDRVLHIVSEAAALFAERGYERTSMRDLAERCGISKSLLYHHFADKQALYNRIAFGFMRELHDFVAARIPADGTARAKVGAFMTATAEFFEHYRLVWLASTDAFWSDPDARRADERMAWRRRYEGLVRGLLAEGVASGELRDVDVAIAGRLLLSALNWLPRWYRPGAGLGAPEIAAMFHGMLFDGLQGPPRKPSPSRRASAARTTAPARGASR